MGQDLFFRAVSQQGQLGSFKLGPGVLFNIKCSSFLKQNVPKLGCQTNPANFGTFWIIFREQQNEKSLIPRTSRHTPDPKLPDTLF